MTEKIGKVTLDYSKYPGEDFYCDGAVEDELLRIARDTDPAEYPRVIEESGSWPILYHLSSQRENIVEWIPMDSGTKVLEVGSGCGAITGVLSRKAGSVTCVELSKKRTLINANRHKDCGNVTVKVGNFKDIEPDLPADYDYILLIGVLEYADSYIGGDTPHRDFLKILYRHLAPGGRIVIAIENKYGLKYFAGCREDHTGRFFDGIEDYPVSAGVRTFGKDGLCRLLDSVGAKERSFYYPYPDYKFMTSIYSDAYLPKVGELSGNIRNFDRDRLQLFEEKSAFDGLIREGSFPFFSNSYLVVLGGELPVKYARYSNDRAPEYAICTRIEQGEDGALSVKKYPLTEAAKAHIGAQTMHRTCSELTKRYAGGGLKINCCIPGDAGAEYSEFEFVQGVPLSKLMDESLFGPAPERFYELFAEYVKRVTYVSESYSGRLKSMDLIFSNILVNGAEWTLIDYEWVTEESTDIRDLIYKAVYSYVLEDPRRASLDRKRVLGMLGLTEVQAAQIERKEMDFQRMVTGGAASMEEIREKIGNEVIRLNELRGTGEAGDASVSASVQIYEDAGEGFSENRSYFVKNIVVGGGEFACELSVPGNVGRLRLDPGSRPCVLQILEISFNGKPIPFSDGSRISVNGSRLKNTDVILFATNDPNICIDLAGAARSAGRDASDTLIFRARADRLSPEIAEGIIKAKRPLF